MTNEYVSSLIDGYINQTNWQVKENANMAYSLQGLNNHIASEISKEYWLNNLYTSEIKNAHNNGDLHIHDLGNISVYCVGWDLQDLLMSGFSGVEGKTESNPPKHFSSALGQIVNFFYTLQGEAAGAQAFANVDTYLAPFIRYDNLSYEEVKQHMQEFIFNLNVATRVGFQTPFTNVTLDIIPPSHLASQPVIIGGKLQDTTYSDYQHEMSLFNKAFLEVMGDGDAKGRVFTFPIPTYNVGKDFNWDNEELNYLWHATAKYGLPYFANFVNSDMNPDDARSMCCRLRIDNRQLRQKGGGLFGANPLTGSIGVVTINMPRIGYLANNEEEFFNRLDSLMDIARDSLETKRSVLEEFTKSNLYPYTSFYLRSIKKNLGKYWDNHFSTIGLVGMSEACENLFGENIGTPRGIEFSTKVLTHMRNRLLMYQETTNNQYNLEATPAEGTSFRLATIDTHKYKDIIVANTDDVDKGSAAFYSNSSHLPVQYTDDPFEVLELQDELQTQYTGGTVIHFFLGESLMDIGAVKEFVKTVCTNYKLPYFTITPTFSICRDHGYILGEHHSCNQCGQETEVYSRIVGYLRPVKQWNDGKRAEFKERNEYVIQES